jgi:hypothetical protein
MSSLSTLTFRDSIDLEKDKIGTTQISVAGLKETDEKSTILQVENGKKSVKFSNEHIVYFYHPEIGLPRPNYSSLSQPLIYSSPEITPLPVYLANHSKRNCNYILPVLIFLALIVILLFFILRFLH